MANDHVQRPLPKPLERLTELALDLRQVGSKTVGQIWRRLDPDAWVRCNNPYMILQNAHQDRLDEAAADDTLVRELSDWFERQDEYMSSPGWFRERYGKSELKHLAYFSMEFGLSESLPIYSGGLGILAGDHLKSASDLNVPVVGIGLLYQQGFFRQVLADDGWQLEAFPFNDPASLPVTPVLDEDGRWPRIRLELPGRTLFLRVWQARVGKVNLYLLDSNHPLNGAWDRGITANLYAAGKEKRLLQELVLGVGGWRLLEKLGIEVQVCHLNEGHAAFAVLARAASFAEKHGVSFQVALRATRAGNVFTTHTPVEAAFDQFDAGLLTKYAGPFIDEMGVPTEEILAMGRRNPTNHDEPFNMAYLAMRGSCHINGVAQLHGQVSKRLFHGLFPGWPQNDVPVGAITNGVHVPTWCSEPAAAFWKKLYDNDKQSWLGDLHGATAAMSQVSDEQLWDYRAQARKSLIEYVRRRLQRHLRERNAPDEDVQRARHVLDPNVLTLGFARRFTEYKRPNLLLHDTDRFVRILRNAERPVQIVVAGKSHPNDEGGKAMVRRMAQFSWREDVRDRVVFLEDYDMVLSQHFAAGVDVWLNNPRRPAEACGTSGMKMLVNGCLHCSTLDGWWDEAFEREVGWAISDKREHGGEYDYDDARLLYELLEHEIAPEFYDRDDQDVPRAWVNRVRTSMTRLTERFSSDRMVRDYVEQAYLPAARAYLRRAADGAKLALELEDWRAAIEDEWPNLRFGRVTVTQVEENWEFRVQAYLGNLDPENVAVQLFAESLDENGPTCLAMRREGPIHGAVGGHNFTATVPANRSADDFTARIVPNHKEACVPLEITHSVWQR